MENNLKLTNRVTVKCGSSLSATHNTLVDLADMLTVEGGYAKYIYVGHGEDDGSFVDGVSAIKRAQLVEYNFDPSNGTLFASYQATFTDDDLVEGLQITKAGLSPYDEGGMMANLAVFDSVTKEANEDLTVKIDIFLTVVTNCLRLTAGENALVKVLLGYDGLDANAFSLSVGENYLNESLSIPRSTDKISQTVVPSVSVTGGNIEIGASFTVTPYELVLSYNGLPVMRGVYISDFENITSTATLRKNSSFDIAQEHIAYINGLESNGNQVTDYEVFPLAIGVTCDCPQLIKHALERGTTLLSEPTGAFVATISDREICVYKVERNALTPKCRIKTVSKSVTLMADGSVYDWSKGLTLNYFDGQKVEKRQLPFDEITDFVATIESGLHHIALVEKGDFKRFTYSPSDGTITEIETIEAVQSDFKLNLRSARFIDYWSVKSALYKSVTISGYSENNQATLKTYTASAATFRCSAHGRWLWRKVMSGQVRLEFMEGSSNFAIKETDTVLYCEHYVLLKRDDVLVLLQPMGTRFTISSNIFSESIEGTPTSVAKVGEYLLITFDDGKVLTAYPIRYGSIVYCYDLANGDVVSFSKVVPVDTRGGFPKCAVTINLTVGG